MSFVDVPVCVLVMLPPAFGKVNFQGVAPSSTTSVIVNVLLPVTVHSVFGGSANNVCAETTEKIATNEKRIFLIVFIFKDYYTVKLSCPLFILFIVYTTTPSHTIIKFATFIAIFAARFIIP